MYVLEILMWKNAIRLRHTKQNQAQNCMYEHVRTFVLYIAQSFHVKAKM